MATRAELLRQLPSVEKLLNRPELQNISPDVERSVVSRCAGEVLEALRGSILSEQENPRCFVETQGKLRLDLKALLDDVTKKVHATVSCSMRRVVNATGVILHTNLGRSVLPKEAIEAVVMAASGYSTLEYDVDKGMRSKRWEHVVEPLVALSGAEDALVVNNNAAAVLLCLNTLAAGKEVIVSRGELVEIGGSFRMPDVMAASGAVLREVGSTNKTKLLDYEHAITDDTALILKVHTSNYRIVGFTEDVSAQDLSVLSKRYKLPLMVDLGSGLLASEESLAMPDGLRLDEPVARDVVAAGADVVTFSADKLLGASQAGVIVGKSDYVRRIAANQLARALRIDKLSLAALDATLRLYVRWPTHFAEFIPTLSMLTASVNGLSVRAEEIRARLRPALGADFEVGIEPGCSKSGGGSLPLLELPTVLVSVSSSKMSADAIERALRLAEVPIITRIAEQKVLIDPRTLLEDDIEPLVDAFRMAAANED
ncbi:MAG TPA: L-seryl-tRNA(Sec) selenium transferase [bacterium]|nr:L-seryl-tRNA(Sec) selenium transferase [bacterium]